MLMQGYTYSSIQNSIFYTNIVEFLPSIKYLLDIEIKQKVERWSKIILICNIATDMSFY